MRKLTTILLSAVFVCCLTGCSININIDPEQLANQMGGYIAMQAQAADSPAAEASQAESTTAVDESNDEITEDALNITAQDIYEANKMSNVLKHKDNCRIKVLYDTFDNSRAFLFNSEGLYYTEYPGVKEMTLKHVVYGYTEDENSDYNGYYCGYLLGTYQDENAAYIDENQTFELKTIVDVDVIEAIKDVGNNTVEITTSVPDEILRNDFGDEYEEGMYQTCIYRCEKDTLIFKEIESTSYHADGTVMYQSTNIYDYNIEVPEGIKELTGRLEEDDAKTLTVIANPDTDDEETITVKYKDGDRIGLYAWEKYESFKDRECTIPADDSDTTIYNKLAKEQ